MADPKKQGAMPLDTKDRSIQAPASFDNEDATVNAQNAPAHQVSPIPLIPGQLITIIPGPNHTFLIAHADQPWRFGNNPNIGTPLPAGQIPSGSGYDRVLPNQVGRIPCSKLNLSSQGVGVNSPIASGAPIYIILDGQPFTPNPVAGTLFLTFEKLAGTT